MSEIELFKCLLKNLRKVYTNKNKQYHIHPPVLDRSDKESLANCIDSKFVSSTGKLVDKFESNIKRITKSKHVISIINGTSALHLSLRLMDIKKNEEVLMPSFNFIASSNACLYVGAIPHYIDSDESLGIDLDSLKNYLEKFTILKNNKCYNIKTKRFITACIPTYSYGHTFDIFSLIDICKKKNIKVIEDSSEALGSFFKKKHAGTFGDIGVLSFNGNKIVTTGGGGAILTNNSLIAKKAKHLSTTAKKENNFIKIHDKLGYNYRMPNLNAALGLSQLNKLQQRIKNKRELFLKLKKSLIGLENYFEVFEENKDSKSNYWIQLLVIKKKNKTNNLLKFLQKNNIMCQKAWQMTNEFNYLKNFPKMQSLRAKNFSKNIICLPSNNF
jgi:perosamine synthetase